MLYRGGGGAEFCDAELAFCHQKTSFFSISLSLVCHFSSYLAQDCYFRSHGWACTTGLSVAEWPSGEGSRGGGFPTPPPNRLCPFSGFHRTENPLEM